MSVCTPQQCAFTPLSYLNYRPRVPHQLLHTLSFCCIGVVREGSCWVLCAPVICTVCACHTNECANEWHLPHLPLIRINIFSYFLYSSLKTLAIWRTMRGAYKMLVNIEIYYESSSAFEELDVAAPVPSCWTLNCDASFENGINARHIPCTLFVFAKSSQRRQKSCELPDKTPKRTLNDPAIRGAVAGGNCVMIID